MAEAQISMSPDQFKALMETIVAESRKPVFDPIKEKQRVRMKEHNRSMQKGNLEMLIQKFRNCDHMQAPGPYTGCAAIAWANQSDGKVRGVCQHCNTLFSPVKEECLAEEIWEAYKHLRRIRTQPGGNVSYTFQNA